LGFSQSDRGSSSIISVPQLTSSLPLSPSLGAQASAAAAAAGEEEGDDETKDEEDNDVVASPRRERSRRLVADTRDPAASSQAVVACCSLPSFSLPDDAETDWGGTRLESTV
jgi:hypothetical protein